MEEEETPNGFGKSFPCEFVLPPGASAGIVCQGELLPGASLEFVAQGELLPGASAGIVGQCVLLPGASLELVAQGELLPEDETGCWLPAEELTAAVLDGGFSCEVEAPNGGGDSRFAPEGFGKFALSPVTAGRSSLLLEAPR